MFTFKEDLMYFKVEDAINALWFWNPSSCLRFALLNIYMNFSSYCAAEIWWIYLHRRLGRQSLTDNSISFVGLWDWWDGLFVNAYCKWRGLSIRYFERSTEDGLAFFRSSFLWTCIRFNPYQSLNVSYTWCFSNLLYFKPSGHLGFNSSLILYCKNHSLICKFQRKWPCVNSLWQQHKLLLSVSVPNPNQSSLETCKH